MLSFLFLLLVFSNGVLPFRRHGDVSILMRNNPEKSSRSQAGVFQQYLDHFSTDDTKWNQRYFVNDEFFDTTTSEAAFLYIGGESLASSRPIKSSATYEAGKRNKGIMFVLEHRFYGQSQPFPDLSTENLKYLTVEQALADVATFISGMNAQYNLTEKVRWVVIGGSYAGSLSTWMRLKYPHLVHASVASSAPLHAQLEFPEYLEIVANGMATGGQECINNIAIGLEQLDNVLSGQEAEGNFTEIFNLCEDLDATIMNDLDKENFYEYVIDSFALVVQSHFANPNVTAACNIMSNASIGNELARIGEIVMEVNKPDCFHSRFEDFIGNLNNVTLDEHKNMRQWWYQTCSQFAWYQVTGLNNTLFKDRITMNFFKNLCSNLYGTIFTEEFIEKQTERTNVEYGGTKVNLTNIVFIHGGRDPWHPVGIFKNRSAEDIVYYLDDEAHCSDLFSQNSKDSQQLIEVRGKVQDLIEFWLTAKSSTYTNVSNSIFCILITFVSCSLMF